jgi:hypothetical protein
MYLYIRLCSSQRRNLSLPFEKHEIAIARKGTVGITGSKRPISPINKNNMPAAIMHVFFIFPPPLYAHKITLLYFIVN